MRKMGHLFHDPREAIYVLIDAERNRQDVKWGDQRVRLTALTVMQCVLSEEVGEVAQAILKGPIDGRANIRRELIQVAATAVAMIEMLDGGAELGVKDGEAG